ncbi:MAG TPA: OsmC family protein [Candidatus Limnocylindrales bacterium]|nr:OsmC family protein [Candidatus Limnocylindrales bacterium]
MAKVIQATLRQEGPSTSRGRVRGHEVLVDRPEAKEGADRGAMGGELLLVALGGCFMSNLLAAIRAREAEISDVRVAVAAELEGTPERMTRFTITVDARHDDEALLRKLATIAERGCLVSNTLAAGAAVEVVLGPVPAAA